MLPNHAATQPQVPALATQARRAGASELAVLLQDSRARTLALARAYADQLGPSLMVPYSPELNPPLWELGHIAWFQETWTSRNLQRTWGHRADPACARSPSVLTSADSLYDSSNVPHASRWQLPLPDLEATLDYLARALNTTLSCLKNSAQDDAALYFFRLALFHEDMHAEAAVYMAQNLGLPLPEALQSALVPVATRLPARSCTVRAGPWQLGIAPSTPGFAFDNELAAHSVEVPAFEIDSAVVSWRRYLENLPKVHSDHQAAPAIPRYLRQIPGAQGAAIWERSVFGKWLPLDMDAPACHLSFNEVQAWCRYVGRTLPTEVQWEKAAMTQPDFEWGSVWEWTASTFEAYPGFEAHPYRDYSQPWFGNRPVLRGACRATAKRMMHPRYRNYFTPERTDIYAGFRTCKSL